MRDGGFSVGPTSSVDVVLLDDLGEPVEVRPPIERVVSLVPSLTEALAATRRSAVVGATDWCTHPGDLAVARVRGPKNPDVPAILGLAPDLVVCNQEENTEVDVRRLRDAGVAVWVTVIESVPQALSSMGRLFEHALGWGVPPWLEQAHSAWSRSPTRGRPLRRVAVPIWRDPWMVVGRDTFTGDLLRRRGLDNVFSGHPGRYPRVPLSEIDNADVDMVLLPDEPYSFTANDGPEAFSTARTKLVSGRLLTWYGPSLIEAAQWQP